MADPVKKSVFFGLATQYDGGVSPRVAINDDGVIIEVHKSEWNSGLWYHVGRVNKATVNWSTSVSYDSGVTPSCAVNNRGQVVEVHKSEWNSGLWYHVGSVDGYRVKWSQSQYYDSGITPSVAINDFGTVVEVHQSEWNSGLWYHVGRIKGNQVEWSSSQKYDSGDTPSVAINNHGLVVEVHKSEWNSGLWYHVGRVRGNSIEWGPSRSYDSGLNPSVALTDEGEVIEVHTSQHDSTLWQRVGRVEGDKIVWIGDAANYDDGVAPSVACAGNVAIQVHQSENFDTLWFSTSLFTDRSNWMGDHLDQLGDRSLKELVLPASHDAGMYLHGVFETLGKTQSMSLYGQLSYGVRYFDLRPGWNGDEFHIYHGIVRGPKLEEVLADVWRYMNEGHRELVILKFSHYQNIDSDSYKKMVTMISDYLSPWLVTKRPEDGRLAEVGIRTFLEDQGAIIAVSDTDLPLIHRTDGIWVYRDWESQNAVEGDLRVYDRYSNTMSYDAMKQDQLDKFSKYDGRCEAKPFPPCDLFLLSWTLTPPTAVWPFSKSANRNLGQAMAELKVPNQHGQIVNLLYVDYVEYARVTDVALWQNGIALGKAKAVGGVA